MSVPEGLSEPHPQSEEGIELPDWDDTGESLLAIEWLYLQREDVPQ
ncbi:MAG: hypothetical protein RTU92_04325 [Candidatus Thorarchaeota archaeon]